LAISLDALEAGFAEDVATLLERVASFGIEMRPYQAIRTPDRQAELWRQSRSTEEIQTMIAFMRANGAPYLADVLEGVGPQHGPAVTNAPPGLSWHQWGEAVDCFWVLDGRAEWSDTQTNLFGLNGYRVYSDEARKMGLEAGGFWTWEDWGHVQARAEPSPGVLMTLEEIDQQMAQRFRPLV